MPSLIRLGCRVSGTVGPLQPSPSGKRRKREKFYGTVIKSAAEKRWTVWWDCIGRCANHPARTLKYEGGSSLTTEWFARVNIDNILNNKNLLDQSGIDRFIANTNHPNNSPQQDPLQDNSHHLTTGIMSETFANGNNRTKEDGRNNISNTVDVNSTSISQGDFCNTSDANIESSVGINEEDISQEEEEENRSDTNVESRSEENVENSSVENEDNVDPDEVELEEDQYDDEVMFALANGTV